ncbi:AlwI family type II restriction endonuclease [Brachyspira catarrhinii]|uniref:AlwI family type II restriction endonuclease n=1 Tax=Brachyspira catarrhinii TaxID=2528966 RepID=A0ABY2TSK5_9SPIR|nr:AlwI family type II restriction endonuclease [Brachyspira catarrhinii]TKZ33893.1 AlwI family type II restriction endonuclease [Brachyspira catarrhinii]
MKFSYKSYFWSIGTTSFRMTDFNLKIEKQLSLLNEFREKFKNNKWRDIQKEYYNHLKFNGFIYGNAKNPEKDARQKTSGLVDIGLIDDNRCITEVGKELLKIVENKNFNGNNLFNIDNDSFIYLKQLLKTHNDINNHIVRPFIIFLYIISKLDYLSNDEFTYLLPLCINKDITENIINYILKSRNSNINSIDDIIINIIMSMENYKSACEYFINSNIDISVFEDIYMDRKSNKNASVYYKIYLLIYKISIEGNSIYKTKLLDEIKNINGYASLLWKKYLFKNANKNNIVLNDIKIFNIQYEKELKEIFFKTLHLFKCKSTLKDYFDLNRRYIKITDIVLFNDNKIELDIIAKYYFKFIENKLFSIAFEKSDKLFINTTLENIDDIFNVKEEVIYNYISENINIKIENKLQLKDIVKKDRYKRFNILIDKKFNKNKIMEILTKIENRDDNEVRKLVTDNADVPTIFEYILSIAWYIISDRKGNILDYMNLYLDSDMLPKTHAAGGMADIVYLYDETKYYPKHDLLIEATLSKDKSQRKMEVEPVSRHLGEYILSNGNKNTYALFISNSLYINVISDFINKRTMKYYSSNSENYINGLNIVCLETSEIKTILEKDINYKELYFIFKNALNSNIDEINWYKKEIKEKIQNLKIRL